MNKESHRLPGFRSLQTAVDKIARPMMGRVGRVQGMLLMYWPEVVGANLSQATSPVRVMEDAHKKQMVLHVNVLSEQAQLVEYQLPEMLEKISIFFGYKAIHTVKLHQVTELSA